MNTRDISACVNYTLGFVREETTSPYINGVDDLHKALIENRVVELQFFNQGIEWIEANMRTIHAIADGLGMDIEIISYKGHLYVPVGCIGILDSLGTYLSHPHGLEEKRQESKSVALGLRYGMSVGGMVLNVKKAMFADVVEPSPEVLCPHWLLNNGDHTQNKLRRGVGHNKFKKRGR